MMNKKKNVLFLGKFFPREMLKTVKEDSKGTIGFSNHNFEMSLINGLKQHQEIELSILTLPNVNSYPRFNRNFWIRKEHYVEDGVDVKSVGFCNLILVNKVTTIYSLLLNLLRYYRAQQTDVQIIVDTPKLNLLLAILLSKLFTTKKISTTLIIPDVPSMITIMVTLSKWKRWIVGLEDNWSMKLANKCDNFVLLTDSMKEFLKPGIRYIVMEGLIDDVKVDSEMVVPSKEIILYTGTLHRMYGVINLLDAFEKMNHQNVELWICGSGDAKEDVERRAKNNSNIRFYGLVDSKTARELQQQATILVNPRTSKEIFTKYSFPSKNMEYLLTGKVVVFNKLPGIPEEYSPYYVAPEDERAESLAKAIDSVLDMDKTERANFGRNARQFILDKKNPYYQVGRILAMAGMR